MAKLLRKILEFFKKLIGKGGEKKPEAPPFVPGAGLLDRGPRGHAMLHLMVPHAWSANCEDLTNMIVESRVREPVTNVLMGGFGEDAGRVNHVVHALAVDGRRPHLLIYVSNGPNQRDWRNTLVRAVEVNMSPEDFRHRIKHDETVRNEMRRRIDAMRAPIASTIRFGGKVRLCPMLEDNLDDDSYFAFDALVRHSAAAINSDIEVVRNDCQGCYPNNGKSVPTGTIVEHHIKSAGQEGFVQAGEVLSNDGVELLMSGETTSYPRSMPIDGMRGYLNRCTAVNAWCIWWGAAQQGLNSGFPDPYRRVFVQYDVAKRARIVEMLMS